MILEVYGRKYGTGTLVVSMESDVSVKTKKLQRIKYKTKVGKKYIMSNTLSLKYLATVLAYQQNKNIAFILRYEDEYIVAVLKKDENRLFHHQTIDIYNGNIEQAHSKIVDAILISDKFIIYTNINPAIIKKDIPAIKYDKFDDKLVNRLSRDLSVFIRPALVALVVSLVIYAAYVSLYPQKENIKKVIEKPPPPPYGLVYDRELSNKLSGSLSTIRAFLNLSAILNKGESIRNANITNGTVTAEVLSWVYRPGYTTEGEMYMTRINTAPVAVQGKKIIEVPDKMRMKYLDIKKCKNALMPREMVVTKYSTEVLPVPKDAGVAYTAKVAELKYSTLSRGDMLSLLRRILGTCVIVNNITFQIDNTGSGRYELYGKVYRKNQ